MPGFELAKLCHKIYNLNPKIEGLILLNHGIFTFGDTAKKSYDRMIKNVTILEKFITKNKINIKFINPTKVYRLGDLSLSIRKKYTEIDGNKWIVKFHNEKKDIEFTLRKDLKELFSKGPVTPDHVIRIKSKPLVLKYADINKIDKLITQYTNAYIKYFHKYKSNVKFSKISDPLPRILIIQGLGYFLEMLSHI